MNRYTCELGSILKNQDDIEEENDVQNKYNKNVCFSPHP